MRWVDAYLSLMVHIVTSPSNTTYISYPPHHTYTIHLIHATQRLRGASVNIILLSPPFTWVGASSSDRYVNHDHCLGVGGLPFMCQGETLQHCAGTHCNTAFRCGRGGSLHNFTIIMYDLCRREGRWVLFLSGCGWFWARGSWGPNMHGTDYHRLCTRSLESGLAWCLLSLLSEWALPEAVLLPPLLYTVSPMA